MRWRMLMARAQLGAARATVDFAECVGRAADARDPLSAARELCRAGGAGLGVIARLAIYHGIARATGVVVPARQPKTVSREAAVDVPRGRLVVVDASGRVSPARRANPKDMN